MFLTFGLILIVPIVFYLICYPFGKLLTCFLGISQNNQLDFFISTAYSFMLLPIIFFLFSLFSVNYMVIFTISIVFWVLLLRFYKSRLFLINREGLIAGILVIIVLIYFSYNAFLIVWPSPGDIMRVHGPIVRLIEINGRLPVDLNPIVDASILYPPGLHVIVAYFNTIFNYQTPLIILAFGVLMSSLFPVIIFKFTHNITNSVLFSFLSSLVLFNVNMRIDLESWLYGYFYNGPYSNMLGLIIMALFASICYYVSKIDLKKYLTACILIIINLLLVYPSFIPYVILTLIMLLVLGYININDLKSIISKRTHVAMMLILSIIIGVLVVNYVKLFIPTSIFNDDPRAIEVIGAGYQLTPYFFQDIHGFFLIIAFFLSIYSVYRRSEIAGPSLLYLSVMFVVLLNFLVNSQLIELYTVPKRSVIILSLLNWPIIFVNMTYFIKKLRFKNFNILVFRKYKYEDDFLVINKKIKLDAVINVSCVLLIFIILLPSLVYYGNLTGTGHGWLAHSSHFKYDYSAINWIAANTRYDDVILTDGSYISWYINSIEPRNITYNQWAYKFNHDRSQDFLKVWTNPYDVMLFSELLNKYDVAYVFTSSEAKSATSNRAGEYLSKPLSPKEYAQIFDEYPFLKQKYSWDATRVYGVNNSMLNYDLIETDFLLPLNNWIVDAWGQGNISSPTLSTVDDTLSFEVYHGNYEFWRIYQYFEPRVLDADYLVFSIVANKSIGLSFFIGDDYSELFRYDLVTRPDPEVMNYCIPLRESVNASVVSMIGMSTGGVSPFPTTSDNLFLQGISLLSFEGIAYS